MKIISFSTLVLTTMLLLSVIASVAPNALAQCRSGPVVGVDNATGFKAYITSGYGGNTGYYIVTAAHVVQNTNPSATVYTNCGTYSESVVYYDMYNGGLGRDLALVTFNGILFTGWYTQASPYVSENIKVTPYSGTGQGQFTGTIYTLNWPPQGFPYQMAACTQTNFGSGTSGSPILDASTGKFVGVAHHKANVNGGLCGSGTWYFAEGYNGA